VEGFWPVFLSILFPSVIPVAILIYLAWSFLRLAPDADQAPPDSSDHDPRRWHRSPRPPRGPRRGPHQPGRAGSASRRFSRRA
jgi:hypothetical protein